MIHRHYNTRGFISGRDFVGMTTPSDALPRLQLAFRRQIYVRNWKLGVGYDLVQVWGA